jgi:hypothetical protein
MSNADTHRLLQEMFNRRDFDQMAEHMRAELHYCDEAREVSMRSAAAFLGWLQEWATAFSDAQVVDAEFLDGGDFTVSRFNGQGTNDGPLGSLAATGNRMVLPFCEILHWTSDGEVESGELYYDQFTLLTQLGHVKAPQGL